MKPHRHRIEVKGATFTPDPLGEGLGEGLVYRACRTCGKRDTLMVAGMWSGMTESLPPKGRSAVDLPPEGEEARGMTTCGHCEGATYVPETCPSCHQLVCGACWDKAVGPVPGPGERAVIWLQALLGASPLGASNVKAAARRVGMKWRTVVRAKEAAGVESVQRPYGWIWRLPASNQNFGPKSTDLALWGPQTVNGEKGYWCKGIQRMRTRVEEEMKRPSS